MKKAIISLTGLSLAALLSACGSSSDEALADPQPVVTVTQRVEVTEQPKPSEPVRSEDGFLFTIHQLNNPLFESESDADILDVGQSTCDSLSATNTVTDVVEYLSSTGDYTSADEIEMVAGMITAAVIHLCPEYSYQLPE